MTIATEERTRENMRPRVIAAADAMLDEISQTPNFPAPDESNEASRHAATVLISCIFLLENEAKSLIDAEQEETNAGYSLMVMLTAVQEIKQSAAFEQPIRATNLAP